MRSLQANNRQTTLSNVLKNRYRICRKLIELVYMRNKRPNPTRLLLSKDQRMLVFKRFFLLAYLVLIVTSIIIRNTINNNKIKETWMGENLFSPHHSPHQHIIPSSCDPSRTAIVLPPEYLCYYPPLLMLAHSFTPAIACPLTSTNKATI